MSIQRPLCVPRIQQQSLNWTSTLPEAVKIDNLALDMNYNSEHWSGSVSSSCSESKFGSCAEDEHDKYQELDCKNLRISTNVTRWSGCEDWDQVMKIKKSPFQGRKILTHVELDPIQITNAKKICSRFWTWSMWSPKRPLKSSGNLTQHLSTR